MHRAELLALRLFDDCGYRIPTEILLEEHENYPYTADSDKHWLFGSLHCASVSGIVETVRGLVEVESCEVSQEDGMGPGSTPLAWAACNGHEEVVTILLERDDVNPDKSDDYGRTPFWGAVLNGHEGVVEILLGRNDVNPDAQDIDGRTPLCCAAQNGHEGFVKMLLERDDVNFNKADDYGRTPLHYAIMEGHIGVVNILFATMVRHSRSRVSDAGRERSIVYS